MKLKKLIRPIVLNLLKEESKYGKTVSYYLPKVKANSQTYYNLDNRSRADFKKLYLYLVKHKDKKIGLVGIIEAEKALNSNLPDYIKKYKAMHAIAHNLSFIPIKDE